MLASETVIGLLLVASTWAMFIPQAVRSVKGRKAGVSPEGWAAIAASRVVMLLYGIAFDDFAQTWSALVPGALALAILAASLREAGGRQRRRTAFWAAEP